ncbi:UDP-2-acetamido-2,6-beta-L-arabino-hexul-4-ose reductase [Conyzicola nivalis]|uniref:UDP-2-acetamido-2,6-beta-L-arabino-hexul-4-ose reductase n=1 Tax=Conyzicola nivalis TaxID=1477021 RepID=A0ABV2QSX8_9MICO
MTRIAITGSNGFLGWHLRSALVEQGADVSRVDMGAAFNLTAATAAVDGADRVIHVAGINRGSDDEVADGNVLFATQLAEAIRSAASAPRSIAFANSTQATNGSIYGESKSRASQVLADAAAAVGAKFDDVLLPNLFGEHGRPFYNAVTSTFSHLIANGETPSVENDKTLTLLHVQNAADLLSGVTPIADQAGLEMDIAVSELLQKLVAISAVYSRGEIPDVANNFDRDLFNTYRSFTFPTQAPVKLTRHADSRGSFFEIIRTHGGTGQSSFSTTEPGISRGDHFHRRKVERFTVLSGTATIALRRMFTDDVIEFEVTGDAPAAVDMPTMWSHNITNTGPETLYTSFWTNDIFNPAFPDTIAEAVRHD